MLFYVLFITDSLYNSNKRPTNKTRQKINLNVLQLETGQQIVTFMQWNMT